MVFKKKAAEAPIYVAPKVVFVASVHHHFALLGGVVYDADEWGFVHDVPPEHYGALFAAGALPLICNQDEVLANLPDDDDDDDAAEDAAEAKMSVEAVKGGKFPGLSSEKK